MTDPNDLTPDEPTTPAEPTPDPELERRTRQWAMFIHFSVLASWLVPLAGVVVPVLLWQLKKDELPGIQSHAYVVLNWIISSLIYGVICFLLLFVAIGVLGFFVLALLTVVYSVVGGVKANDGELWPYPGTIVKLFDV